MADGVLIFDIYLLQTLVGTKFVATKGASRLKEITGGLHSDINVLILVPKQVCPEWLIIHPKLGAWIRPALRGEQLCPATPVLSPR